MNFYDFSGRVSNRHEESYFMSNHTTTSTSLGSRINCTNSNASPVRKSFFQSVSPITTTNILPDGRVERRLETCSYQETEMVRHISSYTVFEIHRKSLIQYCLRSNSVTRPVNFKSQKWVKIEKFKWDILVDFQTMCPDCFLCPNYCVLITVILTGELRPDVLLSSKKKTSCSLLLLLY